MTAVSTSFESLRNDVRFERYTVFVTQITDKAVEVTDLQDLTVEQIKEAQRSQIYLEAELILKQLQAFEKILNILVEDKFSRRDS